MTNRNPSFHKPRNEPHERQRAIFRILVHEPERAFTADEIYVALRYQQTRMQVKSAIACLREKGLVVLSPGDSHDVKGTYRISETGLLGWGYSFGGGGERDST